MTLQNIKKMKDQKGFTIVELLIVIVIIGILAAITIIAYNGITQRAHASAAQQAAQNVVNKAEAYNAENGSYPTTLAALTTPGTYGNVTTTTSSSWYIPASALTFVAGTGTTTNPMTSAPSKDNSISFATCGSGAGDIVSYWNFAQSGAAAATMNAGTTTGTCNYTAS